MRENNCQEEEEYFLSEMSIFQNSIQRVENIQKYKWCWESL